MGPVEWTRGSFVELSQLNDNNVVYNYQYQPPVLSNDNIPAEIKLNSIHQCWRPDLSQSDVIQQICHLMILPLHGKYLLINICNKLSCSYKDIFFWDLGSGKTFQLSTTILICVF